MKNKNCKLYALAIWTVLWGAPVVILAQWSNDPTVNTAICTASGDQYPLGLVSDGSGGVIIVWGDSRNDNGDIHAQRIDSNGVTQWVGNGIPICTANGYQTHPVIVGDGCGGAIIAWHDYRNDSSYPHIYAQRVNSIGNVLWTSDGIAVCTEYYEIYPEIVSDGNGGAIIAWDDYRNANADIFAQRLNSSGILQWAANGTPVCTRLNNQQNLEMINSCSNDVIITWMDGDPSDWGIRAQYVNSSGVVQWGAEGVVISSNSIDKRDPMIVGDGSGGAIITWYGYHPNGNQKDIYAQRIDDNGSIQWTSDGIPICTAIGDQINPTICEDGSGGAYLAWGDFRNGSNYDIYAQHVNSSGTIQWTENGIDLYTGDGYQGGPFIISDGSGGIIIAWIDDRNGNQDIYAQRLNSDGTVQWSVDGSPICIESNLQTQSVLEGDSLGGAIIAWADYRNGSTTDIYAQRVNADGTLGFVVTSHSPTQNALAVAKNTDIQVQFNLDVNPTTTNANTFFVHASQTGLHTGTYSYDSGTKTATLNPTNDFVVGERVTVTLTTSIQTTTGAPLSNPYEWSFTVEADGGSGVFQAQVEYGTTIQPNSVFSADLDGDGYMDLAVTNYNGTGVGLHTVSVFLNNGDGTFQTKTDYETGVYAKFVFSADLDKDGDMDLVVANGGSNTVSILLNNGNGTFQSKTDYGTGVDPRSVFCSDLDGDGYIDLAVANWNSNSISILLNNGNGTFQAKTDYGTGSSPRSVFCSDLDGDGDMDLMVQIYYSYAVSVMLNNGDGTFQPRKDYGAGNYPTSVFSADLDGDGDMDLAVANNNSNTVSILLNNGDGTFQSKTDYGTGNSPHSVFCTDLDGDADIDLAVPNWSSNTVSVLLNNGNGTFQGKTDFGTGNGFTHLFSADLDGDGDMDLAVANSISNTVSILMNISGDTTPPSDVVNLSPPPPPPSPGLLLETMAAQALPQLTTFAIPPQR